MGGGRHGRRHPLSEAARASWASLKQPGSGQASVEWRERQQARIQDCFSCGRSYASGDGRFCSPRCRERFDAGNAPYDASYAGKSNPHWYSLPMGPHGFLIACKGCGKTFDSSGLRCCSADCERRYREREENAALMAKVGAERPTKRKCLKCAGAIPNWRKGRRVSNATKFCSPRCRDRHRKTADKPLLGPKPVLPRETAKRPAKNGPSQRAAA